MYSRTKARTTGARSGSARSSTSATMRSRTGARDWGLSSTTPTARPSSRLSGRRAGGGQSAAVAVAAPVHDAVDQAELLRLLGREEAVALERVADLCDRLAGVLGVDLLHAPAERDRLPRVDLDVGALALVAAVRLVDQHTAVRQRRALALGAAREQQRA